VNNSLAQLAASYGWGGIHPKLAFTEVEFLPIFGFTVIILAQDMLASKSMAL